MGIYVRAHYQGHRVYYALVATWKEGGKTRQRHLKYLGKLKPVGEELERLKAEYGDELQSRKRGRPKKGDK